MIAPTCGCRVVLTGRGGRLFGLIDYCAKHAAVDELLAAAQRMDTLMEGLWDAVPWESTVGLDVALVHEAPLALKRAIAKAEAGARQPEGACG